MRHKSEVFMRFKEYKIMIENQTGNKIKVFRSDNKTEYINEEFQNNLKAEGILHERSAPYTPEQNGASEREIRTIVESACSMLYSRNVATELWSEAVNTTVYLLNRTTLNQQNEITAFEAFRGSKPEVKHLRGIYECSCPEKEKVGCQKSKIIIVGYDPLSNNYRLWHENRRRIFVSCDVKFDEENSITNVKEAENGCITLLYELEEAPDNAEEHAGPEENNESDEAEEEQEENRRVLSDRNNLKRPDYYGPAIYCSIVPPDSYEAAIQERQEWKEAMDEEIDSLYKKLGRWYQDRPMLL